VARGGELPGENDHGTHLKRDSSRGQRTRRRRWPTDIEDVEAPASNAHGKEMGEAAGIEGEQRRSASATAMASWRLTRRGGGGRELR
jgi:hypothetical protein